LQEELWDNPAVKEELKDEVTTEEHKLMPQG
jgi:hypothetical protein